MKNLETAHTRINGKHLLDQVYDHYIVKVKKGFLKDHFRNLLTRSVAVQTGIHADIQNIIDHRILEGDT